MTRRHFFSLYYFWTTLTLETSLDILKIKILVGLILCFAWRAENQPKDIHCEQSWKKKAVSSLYRMFKRITQTPGFVFFIDFKLFYIMLPMFVKFSWKNKKISRFMYLWRVHNELKRKSFPEKE